MGCGGRLFLKIFNRVNGLAGHSGLAGLRAAKSFISRIMEAAFSIDLFHYRTVFQNVPQRPRGHEVIILREIGFPDNPHLFQQGVEINGPADTPRLRTENTVTFRVPVGLL